MVGVHFTRSDATALTRWFVKDHLGSVAVLTDESGAVTERLSFDAWGKRRYADGTDDPTGSITSETPRGFTGHEMIDDVDLVNMNGRIYDPNIGRFMSADPFIHEVTNSQDLNRYSYVHNNPLSYTDMNGYGFFKKLGRLFKRLWKPLLAIVVALTLQFEILPGILGQFGVGTGSFASLGTAAGGATLTQAAVVGVSSGVSNVILTGKPKSFLTGFGQGVATFGVGHGIFPGKVRFGTAKWLGKAVTHGVVGGAFTEIRGGSFKSGFLAAGFSSAAAPLGPDPLAHLWKGAAFGAVTGGAGSVLGGGKFADGAVTGAFVYLFNEAAGGRIGNRAELREQRDQILDDLASQIEALPDAKREFEWGGAAYLNGGEVKSSGLLGGTHRDSNPALVDFLYDHYDSILGYIHNHPSNSYISAADRSEAYQMSISSRRNTKLENEPVVCLLYTDLKGVTDC